MAKKSMIEREKKREAMVKKYAAKRAALKEIVNDESKPMEERFRASPGTPRLCVCTIAARSRAVRMLTIVN